MEFDSDAFMNTVLSEANPTNVVPMETAEYIGQIVEMNAKGGTDKNGKPWASFNPTVEVQYKNAPRKVRGSIFLDLTAAGGIDQSPDKNVGLGRFRKAIGQNTPGQPWNPAMAVGQSVKIKVEPRPGKNDPTIAYDDIKAFLPL